MKQHPFFYNFPFSDQSIVLVNFIANATTSSIERHVYQRPQSRGAAPSAAGNRASRLRPTSRLPVGLFSMYIQAEEHTLSGHVCFAEVTTAVKRLLQAARLLGLRIFISEHQPEGECDCVMRRICDRLRMILCNYSS